MPTLPAESNTQALRRDAETRLKGGTAPATHGWSTGTSALALLHSLASEPSTASDALKLLHELQVHQVELDLQHEQMELERCELEEVLSRATELYDAAPMAYLTVDSAGHIASGNAMAAQLIGADLDALQGSSLDSLAATGSRLALQDLLERVRGSGLRERTRLWLGGAAAPVCCDVVVGRLAHHPVFLVALLEVADADARACGVKGV